MYRLCGLESTIVRHTVYCTLKQNTSVISPFFYQNKAVKQAIKRAETGAGKIAAQRAFKCDSKKDNETSSKGWCEKGCKRSSAMEGAVKGAT